MKEYLEILIAALGYFDENKSATKYSGLPNYSKEDILSLVYLTIREIPSFENLTEEEFAKLPFQTDIQILKTNQAKVSQTVPANLETIVENYDNRELFQADTKAVTNWIGGLKKESRFRSLITESESDPEPLDTEESKKIVSEIKADLRAELQKDTTKKDFSNLETTKTFSEIIKNQAASTGLTISETQAVKISVPYLEYINGLEGEEIADRLSVEKIKTWVANPQEISVGNLLAFEAVEPERVAASGFWASPISTPIKAVVKMGVEEIAKKNPVEATALVLRANNVSSTRIHEMRLLAQSMGVSLQQWDLLESSLKTVRNLDSSGWINALNDARIAGIDEGTAQALFANQTINFQAVAPQHNFLGGIVYRMGQQAFSKISANFIQGSINKVAGAAVKKVVGKVAAGAIGKAVGALATAIPVIGPFVGWLLGKAAEFFTTKVLPWIKKNFRWILVGGGALIGGLVAGLGGALAGGALGAFAAGGGTVAGGIAVLSAGIAALMSVTIAAIALPLIIALVGIPIVVALILFIINSGAYVLPPSGGVAGGPIVPGTGCPVQMWPVSLNTGGTYNVSQGPGGTASHGPPARDLNGRVVAYQEAIDINPNDSAGVGDQVIATHMGIVKAAGTDQWGGNYVEIQSTCGVAFRTLYVHMWSLSVRVGDTVNPGTIIGPIGKTGWAAEIHLHYAFDNENGTLKSDPNRQVYPPPFMEIPYIPKTVPQFCVFRQNCNISVP